MGEVNEVSDVEAETLVTSTQRLKTKTAEQRRRAEQDEAEQRRVAEKALKFAEKAFDKAEKAQRLAMKATVKVDFWRRAEERLEKKAAETAEKKRMAEERKDRLEMKAAEKKRRAEERLAMEAAEQTAAEEFKAPQRAEDLTELLEAFLLKLEYYVLGEDLPSSAKQIARSFKEYVGREKGVQFLCTDDEAFSTLKTRLTHEPSTTIQKRCQRSRKNVNVLKLEGRIVTLSAALR